VGGKTIEERKNTYYQILRNLKPGLTQLSVHLGHDDAELRAVVPQADAWYADFVIFNMPETKELIGDLGIRLVTWRDMANLAAEKFLQTSSRAAVSS
jgi:hypothetical protein